MSDQLPLLIHIDKSDGHVVSDGVRAAIERLAAAVAADESLAAEVVGLSAAPRLELGSSFASALGSATAWRVCFPARNDRTDLCLGVYYDSDEIVGR